MEDLAKRVVDEISGKVLGYVVDLAIDYDTMLQYGFYVVDEETEGEYLLRFEDVQKNGDVILISDFSKLEFVSEREKSLIGKELLTAEGISLGKIDSLVFDKMKLVWLCTDFCQMPSKLVYLVGEDCVFLRRKAKKGRKTNPFKKVINDFKVVALTPQEERPVPERINLSFSYFSGKLSACDIFGYNNERIIAKNEKITKLIFENAKKHNKLNELFFALKK